jgi:hypothetical protein
MENHNPQEESEPGSTVKSLTESQNLEGYSNPEEGLKSRRTILNVGTLPVVDCAAFL